MRLAEETGVSLVGFARQHSLVVYGLAANMSTWISTQLERRAPSPILRAPALAAGAPDSENPMSVDLLNAAEPDATLAPDADVFATAPRALPNWPMATRAGPCGWRFLGQLSLAQSQLSQLPPALPPPPTAGGLAAAATLPAEWPRVLHNWAPSQPGRAAASTHAAIAALASRHPAQLHALAEQVLADARGRASAQHQRRRRAPAGGRRANLLDALGAPKPGQLAASASHCPCCGGAPSLNDPDRRPAGQAALPGAARCATPALVRRALLLHRL